MTSPAPARSVAFRYLPGVLLFVVTLSLCTTPYIGDTLAYAGDALNAQTGQFTGRFNPIWEFGHLLWRPIGAVLAPGLLAVVPDSVAWTPLLKIAWGLTVLNYLAGLLISAILYSMALRFTESWKAAAFLALVMIWANGFLMYTQSGSSYVFALLFEVGALQVQFIGRRTGTALHDILSGLLLALAVLLWFPFILVFPAVAATRWIVEGMSLKDGMRHFLRTMLAGAAAVAIGLAAGAFLGGVRSITDLSAWYLSAQHGWDQNRRLLRAISGVPRLLIDLSADGISLKRYTFRDPYNPVSLWDLLRGAFLKLIVFYLLLSVSLVQAWFWRTARPLLYLFLVAAVPLVWFSIVLFEPSSPERFLPVLPFLVLTWAAAWPSRWRAAQFLRVSFVVLASTVILINAQKFSLGSAREDDQIVRRLKNLDEVASRGDILMTVTFSEPQVTLIEQRPFHPYNRTRKVVTYQLVEVANKDAHLWRKSFAAFVLSKWPDHQVWLSKSVRDSSPRPGINWVEGDTPKVSWSAFPSFFTTLQYDTETSDEDGYIRLARNPHNRDQLKKVLE